MSSTAPGADRAALAAGPSAWTYVALGSNLGDSATNLREAAAHLADLAPVMARSSIYATTPVGGPAGQGEYLNAVIAIATLGADPAQMLTKLLAIETAMGRVRRERWGPRVIDLDLLAVGDRVSASEGPPHLVLPHPRLPDRAFVLVPLSEIASLRNVSGPPWVHPVSGLGALAMLERLHSGDGAAGVATELGVRCTDLTW